jgi:hypothetical protein
VKWKVVIAMMMRTVGIYNMAALTITELAVEEAVSGAVEEVSHTLDNPGRVRVPEDGVLEIRPRTRIALWTIWLRLERLQFLRLIIGLRITLLRMGWAMEREAQGVEAVASGLITWPN